MWLHQKVMKRPKSKVDIICDNIIENVDMSRLRDINFDKLSKDEQNRIEESIYEMMEKFKKTPLELDNSMPKELNSLIENKWHYCLNLEKQIRESTLQISFQNLRMFK